MCGLGCRTGTQSTCYIPRIHNPPTRGASRTGSCGAASHGLLSLTQRATKGSPRPTTSPQPPGGLQSNSTSGARQRETRRGEEGEQHRRFVERGGPWKLVPNGDGAASPLAFHSFTPWLRLLADPVVSFPSFPAALFLCLAPSQLVKTVTL